MNRQALQDLSRQRRREAAVLLKARHFPGAYYLTGYSVECALKACLAKNTRRHDFPDRRLATEAWTHNLQKLMQLSGLWPQLQQAMRGNRLLELNWTIVKDWSESVRYDLRVTRAQARDFYSACTARSNGILPWIRARW